MQTPQEEYDNVEVNEDEDEGFCKVCNKWEPICKFLEGDVLIQPCKGCFTSP
jgi:hypothetical protein